MKKEKLYISTVDANAHLLAKEYGLGLEIAEYCTAWNMDDQFAGTDRAVREKLSCADRFVMHGPYSELFPCAIDPKIRRVAAERYRQVLGIAGDYGISKVVLHGGYNPWIYFPCWFEEQSVIFWKEFEIPENRMICLENVLEETPSMLAEIIRKADNPGLRMCLDVGHANAYSKVSPMEWVRECADIISHVHIHNNDGTGDTHSGLPDGTIPMEALLEEIGELCPDATLTMELMDAKPSLEYLQEKGLLEE